MDGIEVTGLDELIVDLDMAAATTPAKVRQVVSKGSLNVKKDWRKRWSGISHAPRIPASITYDLESTADQVRGEIGPDRDLGVHLQGFLGRVFELGGIHSAPMPGGMPALDEEAPRFEKALADLGAKLLSGGR